MLPFVNYEKGINTEISKIRSISDFISLGKERIWDEFTRSSLR